MTGTARIQCLITKVDFKWTRIPYYRYLLCRGGFKCYARPVIRTMVSPPQFLHRAILFYFPSF